MSLSLSQRLYYVNTLFKKTGTNQSFSFEFQIPATENYDRVVLLQATIPNTFYLIQDSYNTFTLREDGVDTKIIIPPGNYSAKVFAKVLSPLMTQSSPNGWIYTVTLPDQNQTAQKGKFIYSVTGNTSEPSIICTDHVNEQLGFNVFSTNTFVNGSIESTTSINFGPESMLFIHSDIANSGNSDVLQEIYAGNTESMSYIVYQCTAPELYSKVLQTNKSTVFNFSLSNEKNQLMNLNGVDMQLTLCLYKRDNTNEMIRKYIQYKVQETDTSE